MSQTPNNVDGEWLDKEAQDIFKTVCSRERMIFYYDKVGYAEKRSDREECHRDDLWAIATVELAVLKKKLTQAYKKGYEDGKATR